MGEERACASCRFFRRGAVTAPDPAWTGPPSAVPTVEVPAATGRCQRFPPQIHPVIVDRTAPSAWPAVAGQDTCGEHQPRAEEGA